jgi:SAM-dependent methyltransferase
MIDYARISKMLEYQEAQSWPLYIGDKNVFRRGTRGWEYPWVLEQLAGLPKDAKILDCGCGTSGFVGELYQRNYKPTGLDFFVGDVQERPGYGLPTSYISKLQGKITFIDGGMVDIPADDNTFDAVTSISVMEHIIIDYKDNPSYHFKCLDEMKRVLKPGGLLICTYDTILNAKVVYGGTPEWGEQGWYYLDDIDYLDMAMKLPNAKRVTREDVMLAEDAFFVPPDLYFEHGYGSGFELFGSYHRLTSVGFALIKR